MVVTDPAYEIQQIYQNYGEGFTGDILAKMAADVEEELRRARIFTIVRNTQRYLRRIKRGDERAANNLRIVKAELQRQ